MVNATYEVCLNAELTRMCKCLRTSYSPEVSWAATVIPHHETAEDLGPDNASCAPKTHLSNSNVMRLYVGMQRTMPWM